MIAFVAASLNRPVFPPLGGLAHFPQSAYDIWMESSIISMEKRASLGAAAPAVPASPDAGSAVLSLSIALSAPLLGGLLLLRPART